MSAAGPIGANALMSAAARSVGHMSARLHVLDHSIPLQSGYTFRTRAILREQRRMGWETFHLTSPKHSAPGAPEEEVDGLHFYRTPPATGALERHSGRPRSWRRCARPRAASDEVARVSGPTSCTPTRRC